VVSGVGVLDKVHITQMEGDVVGVFWSIGLNGVLDCIRKEERIQLMHAKFILLPYELLHFS